LADFRLLGAFILLILTPTPGKSYSKMIREMARGTTSGFFSDPVLVLVKLSIIEKSLMVEKKNI
jgi:hypothetical protein